VPLRSDVWLQLTSGPSHLRPQLLPQAHQIQGERPRTQLIHHRRFMGLPPPTGLEHLLRASRRNHDRAVGIHHDHVAGLDPHAAHAHGHVERARFLFGSPAGADEPGPDREPQLVQFICVPDGSVDQQASRPAHLRLERNDLANQGHGLGLRHRQHQDLARLDPRQRGVHREVVPLTAQDGAGRPRGPAPRDHALEGHVYEPPSPRRLVDRRHPEATQPDDHARGHACHLPVHRDLTTCGIARWKASA
jgi:hypothetical protein